MADLEVAVTIKEVKTALKLWNEVLQDPKIRLSLKEKSKNLPSIFNSLQVAQDFANTAANSFDEEQKIKLQLPQNSDINNAVDFEMPTSSAELLLEVQPLARSLEEQFATPSGTETAVAIETWVNKLDELQEQTMTLNIKLVELDKKISAAINDLYGKIDSTATPELDKFVQQYADMRQVLQNLQAQLVRFVGSTDYKLHNFAQLAQLILKLNKQLLLEYSKD